MQKIDNIYKSGSSYIITNYPEKYNSMFVSAFARKGGVIDVDSIIDRTIELYNNYTAPEEGYYFDNNHPGYVINLKPLSEEQKIRYSVENEDNICNSEYFDVNGNRINNSTFRFHSGCKFISKDKQEALQYLENQTTKLAAKKFIETIVGDDKANFHREGAKFLYNNCLELINSGQPIEKFTINGELSLNKITNELRNIDITKARFKERFKHLKRDGILTMFQ